MTQITGTEFAKHYREDLRRHLDPASPTLKDPGKAIGAEAASQGFDRLDVTRIHARIPVPAEKPKQDGPPPTEGRKFRERNAAQLFLDSALATIVRENRRMVSAGTDAPHTRVELKKEIEKRVALEKKLKRTAAHYNRLLARSKRMQRQAKRLAHGVLLAQEAERKEISRDLHDEVAQTLAGINVQLAALKEISAVDGLELRKRIARTQLLVGRSVKIVHRYARELRPSMLDDLGLIPALRSYIRDLPGRRGLVIRFTAPAGVETLDNNRSTVLYRVVQEALTNICRHAGADVATVRLRADTKSVRLEVHDDGKSFVVASKLASTTNRRLGLLGMKERVEMVGGLFSVESTPGKGTRVCARIPFRGKLREPSA